MRAPLRLVLLASALLAPAVAGAAEPACAALEAGALLDRVDDLFRGASSHGVFAMKVQTVHWARELKVEVWTQGKERSLVKVLEPAKEKGVTTLKAGADVWNYLPKVDRVVKVPSSMMGGAWMGSHFTNDDLVRESRMADDYASEKTLVERDGRRFIEIRCTPRPDGAVTWGKVVVEIDPARCLPTRQVYYDEDLKVARTLTLSEVRTLGGRELPTLMSLAPEGQPGERTEVRYLEIAFDVTLPAALFTLRGLQR